MGTASNAIATRENCNGLISGLFSSDLYKCTTKSEINSGKKLMVLESDVVGNKIYNKSYTNNQLVKYDDLGYYTKCEYETDDDSNFSPIIKIYNKYIDPANESEPSDYIWELTPFNTSVTNSPTGSVDLGLSKDFFTSVNTSNVNITARNTASTTPLTKFKLNNYEGLASNNGNYFIWHMPKAASVIDSINSLKELIIFMTNIVDNAISVSPTKWSAPYSASTKNISVVATGDWTASSDKTWCTVSKSSGYGDDTVTLSVTAATSTSSTRTATVTFTCGDITRTVKVTQAKKPSLTVSPTSWDTSSASSTKTITVTSNGNWTVSSNKSWLYVGNVNSTSASGSGNGSVILMVAANATSSDRSGTVTFKCENVTKTVSVNQEQNYTLTVSPTSWTGIAYSGGTKSVTITSSSNWTIDSNPSWITASKSSGSSGDVITLTAAENTNTTSRTGTITFKCGDKTATITITQDGKSTEPEEPDTPTYRLSVTVSESTINAGSSTNATAKFYTKTNGVEDNGTTVTTSCTWSSSDSNIASVSTTGRITSKSGKYGTVKITATHTVAGQTYSDSVNVTVNYTRNYISLSSSSVTLVVGETHKLTATYYTETNGIITESKDVTNETSWSGGSGYVSCDSNGLVTALKNSYNNEFSITASYNGYSAKCGFIVNKPNYSISVDTESWTSGYSAESKTITVSSNDSWTASVSSLSSWLTVSPAEGSSGDTIVTLSVTENTSTSLDRSATVTFKCKNDTTKTATVEVKQLKKESTTYAITVGGKTSNTWSAPAFNASTTFSLAASHAWAVSDKPSWLTVTPDSGNAGDTTITLTAENNTSSVSRDATVTFTCGTATATVSVTQAGMEIIFVGLNSISASKDSVSNTVGKSSLVIITATYSDKTTKNVTSYTTGSVTSGNTSSASYNAGIISHNAVGTAEITVSYTENFITKTCTINVETTAETSTDFTASSKIQILSAITPINTEIALLTGEIGMGLTSNASGTDVSKTYYSAASATNITTTYGPILEISYTLPYELNSSSYHNLYFMIKLKFNKHCNGNSWGLKTDYTTLPNNDINTNTNNAAAGYEGGLLRLSDYWTYEEFMNGKTTPLKLYVTGSPKL